MSDIFAFVWVAVGASVAVIFPVLRAYVKEEFPKTADVGIPPWLKRYIGLFAFSLITALICLALWKSQYPTNELHWFTAFLLGFGWESAVEKIGRP